MPKKCLQDFFCSVHISNPISSCIYFQNNTTHPQERREIYTGCFGGLTAQDHLGVMLYLDRDLIYYPDLSSVFWWLNLAR